MSFENLQTAIGADVIEDDLYAASAADAAETLAFGRRALAHVAETAMDRFRPRKFRRFLPVDGSVPRWAQTVERHTIHMTAQWKPISSGGWDDTIEMADVDADETIFKMFEFGSGYRYSDTEVERSRMLKANLPAAKASACMQSGEMLLETIASLGALGTTTKQLKGFYNVLTGGQVGTAALVDAVGDFHGDWVNATIEEITYDMLQIEQAVIDQSKETEEPDLLVLPMSVRPTLLKTASSASDKTVIQLVQERFISIRRIGYWVKGNTAGAGGKTRAVALNSRNPDVMRMVISEEPSPLRPLRTRFGFEVPVRITTGGVVSDYPAGAVYADGV